MGLSHPSSPILLVVLTVFDRKCDPNFHKVGVILVCFGLAFMLCAWVEPSEYTFFGRISIFFTVKLPGYAEKIVLRVFGERVHKGEKFLLLFTPPRHARICFLGVLSLPTYNNIDFTTFPSSCTHSLG